MPHDTSRGRTSPHPPRPAAARTGRAAQAHAARPRPGKASPARRTPHGPDTDAAGDGARDAGGSAEPPTLQHVVEERGPLPAPRLRRVAARTAAALAAKHRAGTVHRGLHPGNVLLGPDGAKVIGFGAAAPDAGPAGAPASMAPAYMAPEQIEDEPVGRPADVFAWGATVVFAATGRPPFGTGPSAAVMRRVTSREPDLGDMRGPLRDLAARCLDKNPAARPTAPQVVRALREGQGPMPKPRPTRIPRYRWRMMVALAAVVVAGFVLGMLF
ncbi:protein kinase [Actinomadura sp. 7K507]|uniref:protein kinase domain-containing protein n=1 Tax=Actinomadura sp. 7K507 TaxID=2530365 RepID=UPI00104FA3BD|nr:protein kinase [Actinomadura sp. 7K507]TDC80608.1 serine/threonine protein kinase [Actinomadura sp. 7K507]